MIKIIVAEDQQLILKDLCRKIEKSSDDIEIVATAMNGNDAYQKILEFQPDILFTDIVMPIKSGLDLIRQLKQENINIKTVIISGYKEFSYAQEAIKLNVNEYLLKPISIDDIHYVLNILSEKIIVERETLIHKTLEALVNAPKDCGSSFDLKLSYQYYYLFLINFGSYTTFTLDYTPLYECFYETLSIDKIISSHIQTDEKYYSCYGKYKNQKLLLLCLNKTSRETLRIIANQLISSGEASGIPVTICISRRITYIRNIGFELQIMRYYIANNLIFGKSSIIEYRSSNAFNKLPLEYLTTEWIQRFSIAVKNNDFNRFHKELQLFLDILQKKSIFQKTLESTLKRLFQSCFRKQLLSINTDIEPDIDEYITNSKNYSELFSYLDFCANQLMYETALNRVNTCAPKKLVEDIKQYIHENYSKDMKINDIAIHFCLTPSYLSRMFKKYTNTKPIEYLTNYRIKCACNYLQTTQFSIKEIAELCGYPDAFYFSKTFKSFTKFSPSEYRVRMQQELF